MQIGPCPPKEPVPAHCPIRVVEESLSGEIFRLKQVFVDSSATDDRLTFSITAELGGRMFRSEMKFVWEEGTSTLILDARLQVDDLIRIGFQEEHGLLELIVLAGQQGAGAFSRARVGGRIVPTYTSGVYIDDSSDLQQSVNDFVQWCVRDMENFITAMSFVLVDGKNPDDVATLIFKDQPEA